MAKSGNHRPRPLGNAVGIPDLLLGLCGDVGCVRGLRAESQRFSATEGNPGRGTTGRPKPLFGQEKRHVKANHRIGRLDRPERRRGRSPNDSPTESASAPSAVSLGNSHQAANATSALGELSNCGPPASSLASSNFPTLHRGPAHRTCGDVDVAIPAKFPLSQTTGIFHYRRLALRGWGVR